MSPHFIPIEYVGEAGFGSLLGVGDKTRGVTGSTSSLFVPVQLTSFFKKIIFLELKKNMCIITENIHIFIYAYACYKCKFLLCKKKKKRYEHKKIKNFYAILN